jgi:hypothetical protein
MAQAKLLGAMNSALEQSNALPEAKAGLRAALVGRLLHQGYRPTAAKTAASDAAVCVVSEFLQEAGMTRTLAVLDAEYGSAFPVPIGTIHEVMVASARFRQL